MEFFLEDFSFSLFLWQFFGIALLVGWVYILYEIVTSAFPGNEGMLWALLVFFVPIVGALAYSVYGRSSRLKIE